MKSKTRKITLVVEEDIYLFLKALPKGFKSAFANYCLKKGREDYERNPEEFLQELLREEEEL